MIHKADLDSKTIQSEIYSSFHYDFKKVIEQIRTDVPRMRITLQSGTTDLTFDQLISYNLSPKILLLCTQATFFYLFNVIYERYHLGNQIVVADSDRPSIRIIVTSDSYTLVCRKSFLVMDAESDEIIVKYHACAMIDPISMRILYRE